MTLTNQTLASVTNEQERGDSLGGSGRSYSRIHNDDPCSLGSTCFFALVLGTRALAHVGNRLDNVNWVRVETVWTD
jgi:hypothetical protein